MTSACRHVKLHRQADHCSAYQQLPRKLPANFAGRQKSLAAAAKKQEQDRQLLVELLKEDQIGVREYIWNNQRVQSYQPLGNKQRGIVICAGGNKLLINVYVSLKVIFKLH